MSAALFADHLARVRDDVDRELALTLDVHVIEARAQGPVTERVLAATRDLALRGGKRFRPAMLAAAYEACGGADGPGAVTLAGVALELLQAYLLIHDDWMDEDDVRRGGPTVHAALAASLGSKKLGDALAVLAGDYASAAALDVLLRLPLPEARVRAAVREFARLQESVVLGQILDVHGGVKDAAAVERMHDLKTGSYTVRGPLAMGAALAGATEPQRSALDRFARPLGVAFQLRDDLLGTFGDPKVTGKPAGSDLRQGKRTALVAEVERDPIAAPMLARVLGARGDAAEADVRALAERMIVCGARARVEARLDALLAEARAALADAPFTESGKALLAGAVQALGERER